MLRSPDRLRPPPELRSDPAAQGACFLATVTGYYRHVTRSRTPRNRL